MIATLSDLCNLLFDMGPYSYLWMSSNMSTDGFQISSEYLS